jgi:BASS family bile acid:Na+ symporter
MQLLQQLSTYAAFINTTATPWVLRLVMAGLGLSLTVADFKRVVVYPKAVGLGLIAQIFGQPLLGFALAILFPVPPAIAMGLVILASCPSGVTSNAYTFASRADVPLCVTLSALTSIVTVFTIPVFINLGLRTFDVGGELQALPFLQMLINLTELALVPLAVGMLVRAAFAEVAARAVEPIRKTVFFLMVCVLVLGAAANYQTILDHFAIAGALVLTMNLLSMSMGYGLARLFRLPTAQVVTLTFEVGVHNLTLAYAITFTMLKRPDLASTALLYAVVMPATALAFVAIAKRLLAADVHPSAVTQPSVLAKPDA